MWREEGGTGREGQGRAGLDWAELDVLGRARIPSLTTNEAPLSPRDTSYPLRLSQESPPHPLILPQNPTCREHEPQFSQRQNHMGVCSWGTEGRCRGPRRGSRPDQLWQRGETERTGGDQTQRGAGLLPDTGLAFPGSGNPFELQNLGVNQSWRHECPPSVVQTYPFLVWGAHYGPLGCDTVDQEKYKKLDRKPESPQLCAQPLIVGGGCPL